jgi:hypothetical protein
VDKLWEGSRCAFLELRARAVCCCRWRAQQRRHQNTRSRPASRHSCCDQHASRKHGYIRSVIASCPGQWGDRSYRDREPSLQRQPQQHKRRAPLPPFARKCSASPISSTSNAARCQLCARVAEGEEKKRGANSFKKPPPLDVQLCLMQRATPSL